MSTSPLPGPVTRSSHQEHPVAQKARVEALLERIPQDAATLSQLAGRHLLSIAPMTPALLGQVFRLAARFELGQVDLDHPMRGKILSNVFLDNSHNHTRLSFNSAWLRLGGSLLNFEKSIDEITGHRHAADELAELCSNYGDIAVLRTDEHHHHALEEMVETFRVPVINAGSGHDEHPTNAMADLYTLFKWRPELLQDEGDAPRRLQIGVFGDAARTRTIRSLLLGLVTFRHAIERVVFFQRLDRMFEPGQREALAQAGLTVQTVQELMPLASKMHAYEKLLPEMDVMYVHNLHPSQYSRMELIQGIKHLKPDCMVFNPHIQSQEFSDFLNNGPHNAYFAQARGGVFVRMALFSAIMGLSGI
jgi:aspartate carbamoyltransferase catalytic subunit